MKRLVELTVEDLAAHPVWRYEGGIGPAAIVAPVLRGELSREDDEVFLGATDYELFDGTAHKGFCFPVDDSGVDYLQPAIIAPSGHVNFWTEGPVRPEELAARWAALGKQEGAIFPVSFRCRVPVDGRLVTGWIAGVESSRDLTVAIREMPGAPPRPDEPPPETQRAPGARPVLARRQARTAADKRAARRRETRMTVEFTQESLRGTGVAENVTRHGVFVRASRSPGAGPPVRLTLNLPDGRKLVVTGRVVRSADEAAAPGFGLRLTEEWPNYDTLFPPARHRRR